MSVRRVFFKYSVYCTGTLFVLWVAAQLFLWALFDPYRIQAALNDALADTGCRFSADNGNIARSWFPAPNVSLHDAVIRRADGGILLEAERVNLRLRRIPGNGWVSKVLLVRPQLFLRQETSGRWNAEKLLQSARTENTAPPRWVADRMTVHIRRADGTLHSFSLSGEYRKFPETDTLQLTLHDGRIRLPAAGGKTFRLPETRVHTQIVRNGGIWHFTQVKGSLKGALPYLGQTAVSWQIPYIRYDLATHDFVLPSWRAEGTGAWQNLAFSLGGDTVYRTEDAAQTAKISAVLHGSPAADAVWDGVLRLEQAARTAQGATARLEWESTHKSADSVSVFLLHAAIGNAAENGQNVWRLGNVDFSARQTDAAGRNPRWQTHLLADSVRFLPGRDFAAAFSGSFDQMPLTLHIARTAAADSPWEIRAALQALDLSPYLAAGSVPQADTALRRFNRLSDFAADTFRRAGRPEILADVRIGRLAGSGWSVDDFAGRVRAGHRGAAWEEMSGSLYGGSFSGSIAVANTAPREYRIRQQFRGVRVRDWLWDSMGYAHLDGRGDIDIDISMAGADVNALRRSLRGNTVLNIRNGSLRGIDLHHLAQNPYGNIFSPAARTPFDNFSISTRWVGGTGYTPLLALHSPSLTISGSGQFDLAHNRLDYALSVNAHAADRPYALPLRIGGTPANPTYALDYKAITGGIAPENRENTLRKFLQQQWHWLK